MAQTVDIDAVSKIIRETARDCLIPHFQHLLAGEVTTKSGPTDFVTVADTEAESMLSKRLKELIPDSIVVGEEVAFKNPDVLDSLSYPNTYIWIIDPLDGTKNFIKGKDVFGIIVALVKNGQTIAGWINIPLHDNLLIAGEKGAGVLAQGQKITLASPLSDLTELKGTLSIELPTIDEKIKNKLWWGSAAFSYAMLLSGVVDFGIYSTHPLQPWDHAAGVFLHSELGGFNALSDGTEYLPQPINGSLILAPNKEIWQTMAEAIGFYMS